eukprot:SAG11_NODE_3891_length_2163_cov_1.973837_2_plen_137_part_00
MKQAVLTEICSAVLEETEQPLRSGSPHEPWSVAPVVNALKGVVLSYHFGFNKKKLFPYLRRFASDQMTANVAGILDGSADTAAMAARITAQICEVIVTKQQLAVETLPADTIISAPHTPSLHRALSSADVSSAECS